MAEKQTSEAMADMLKTFAEHGVKITPEMRAALKAVEEKEATERTREILNNKLLTDDGEKEEETEIRVNYWLDKLTDLATEFVVNFEGIEQNKQGRGNGKITRHMVGFDLPNGSHLQVRVDVPVKPAKKTK